MISPLLVNVGLAVVGGVVKTAVKLLDDNEPAMEVSSRKLSAAEQEAVELSISHDAVKRWVADKYDPRAMNPNQLRQLADELQNAGVIGIGQHQKLVSLFAELEAGSNAAFLDYDVLGLLESQYEQARAGGKPDAQQLQELRDILSEISELRTDAA